MGLFGRRRGAEKASGVSSRKDRKAQSSAEREHLEAFAHEHTGVEVFVEPPTAVIGITVMLVASTGEWTRRPAPSAAVVHHWANKLGLPSYDAAVVGYPQRMRDYNSRKAAEQKRRRREDLGL